jgi:hypothetical protein
LALVHDSRVIWKRSTNDAASVVRDLPRDLFRGFCRSSLSRQRCDQGSSSVLQEPGNAIGKSSLVSILASQSEAHVIIHLQSLTLKPLVAILRDKENKGYAANDVCCSPLEAVAWVSRVPWLTVVCFVRVSSLCWCARTWRTSRDAIQEPGTRQYQDGPAYITFSERSVQLCGGIACVYIDSAKCPRLYCGWLKCRLMSGYFVLSVQGCECRAATIIGGSQVRI